MTANPWLDLPESPPYVLPSDAGAVERFNAGLKAGQEAFKIQVDSVIPEPFVGDPRTASVVVLLLNAGYKSVDDAAHADPAFLAALHKNLRHEPTDFPFYFLDPEFKDTPGGAWWRARLRWLIADTSLEQVAHRLACVEWFTYKSTSFKTGCRVPSQRYGHALVADTLARGALVVPLRARKVWEQSVPALARQRHDITTASQQSVYLSPGNLKLNGAKTPEAYDLLVNALGS